MASGKIVGSREQYRMEEVIAKGAFSVVYRCTDLSQGRSLAIKVVNKDLAVRQHMAEALIREVNAMEVASSSPYIVHLVDRLVSKNNFYIIMELAEGGTLLDFTRRQRRAGHLTSWVAPFFKQLLMGVAAMHAVNVIHRDLKPENILLNGRKTRLVISDFGFACYSPPGHTLHRACGTLRYCAPELLEECPSYDGRKVDVWAAGVTLFVMLCGTHPFSVKAGIDPDALLHLIHTTTLSYPRHVSAAARDLLGHMLAVDPAERWSTAELLQHPWLADVSARLPGDDAIEAEPEDGPHGSSAVTPMNGAVPAGAVTYGSSPPTKTEASALQALLSPMGVDKGLLTATSGLDDVDDGFYNDSCRPSTGPSFAPGDSGSDADDAAGREACAGAVTPPLPKDGVWSSSMQAALDIPTGHSSPARMSQREDPASELASLTGSMSRAPELMPCLSRAESDSVGSLPYSGCLLTLKSIVSFIVFCWVLFFATVLHQLFGMRVSDLPLPRRLCALLDSLLNSPHGPCGQEDRDTPVQSTSNVHGLLGGRHAGGVSPLPGSQIRRYVRKAERLISDSTTALLPQQPGDPPSLPSAAAEGRQNADADAPLPIESVSASEQSSTLRHRRRQSSPPLPPPQQQQQQRASSLGASMRATAAARSNTRTPPSRLSRTSRPASLTLEPPTVLRGEDDRSGAGVGGESDDAAPEHLTVFSPSVPFRRLPGHLGSAEDFPLSSPESTPVQASGES